MEKYPLQKRRIQKKDRWLGKNNGIKFSSKKE
jgi:hypothetical protein